MRRLTAVALIGMIFIFSCTEQQRLSGTLEIPDALFRYTAEGRGLPCVAFTGSDNLGSKAFTDRLREHINFIHVDFNDLDTDAIPNITIDAIVDDIDKVRMAIGKDKIAVLGISMFGTLPFEYALKYPNHISHGITIGSRPFWTQECEDASKEYWETFATDERKEIYENNVKEYEKMVQAGTNNLKAGTRYAVRIPRLFYDPHYDMSDIWEGITVNGAFNRHYSGSLMKDLDHTDEYEGITSPMMVMSGRYDFWGPHYLWEDVTSKMSDCTFHVFNTAGHNPMLEVADEFDSLIIDWIGSNH